MKKILGILLSLAVLGLSFTGCSKKDSSGSSSSSSGSSSSASSGSSGSSSSSTSSKKDGDILIGVSIWSSTDTLGSQCKRILDAAAKALGVNLETLLISQPDNGEQALEIADNLIRRPDATESSSVTPRPQR